MDCNYCVHQWQETLDDVACCNCCEEDGISFFQQESEEYCDRYTLADLGNNWW